MLIVLIATVRLSIGSDGLVDDAHRPAPELAEDGVAAQGLRFGHRVCGSVIGARHGPRTPPACGSRSTSGAPSTAAPGRRRRPLRALHRRGGGRGRERVAHGELLARGELQLQRHRRLQQVPDLDRVLARRHFDAPERRRPPAVHAVDHDLAPRLDRERDDRGPLRGGLRALPRGAHREAGAEEAGDREAGEDERAPARGRRGGAPPRRRRRPAPRTRRARACAGSRRSRCRPAGGARQRSGSVGTSASRKARETRIRPGPEKPAIVAPVATLSPARHGSPRSSDASRIAPWSTPIRSANGSAPSPRASRRTLRAASSASDGAARTAIARPSGASATMRSAGSSCAIERATAASSRSRRVACSATGLRAKSTMPRNTRLACAAFPVGAGMSVEGRARYLTRMPGCAPESGARR